MGVWTYTDSALGEVLTRRDARNVTTLFCYDKLGRTTYKSASVDVDANGTPDAVVDTWLFDPPGALGQLWSATRQINAVLEKRSTYTYDPLARPSRRSSQQNQGGGTTQTFVTDTVYDGNYGRPKQLIHPSGDSVLVRYTQYGQLDASPTSPALRATAASPRSPRTARVSPSWVSVDVARCCARPRIGFRQRNVRVRPRWSLPAQGGRHA